MTSSEHAIPSRSLPFVPRARTSHGSRSSSVASAAASSFSTARYASRNGSPSSSATRASSPAQSPHPVLAGDDEPRLVLAQSTGVPGQELRHDRQRGPQPRVV